MAAVARDVATQACRDCGEVKPLDEFYLLSRPISRDYRDCVCKRCRIEQSIRRRERTAKHHAERGSIVARFLAMPRRLPPRSTD